MHGLAAAGTSLLVRAPKWLHKMARMATAGPAPLDEDEDGDVAGAGGVDDLAHPAGAAEGRRNRSAPPEHVAGLPLVDRPRLSAEDVDFLRQYLGTRRQKLANSRLRLLGFAAVVVALLIVFDGQLILRYVGIAVLAYGLILALTMMSDWRRQRVLVEADLREGYLCRYEGIVPASGAGHPLVKNGLIRANADGVQRVDVLPVSRKVHRTNGSLHWTWCQVRS